MIASNVNYKIHSPRVIQKSNQLQINNQKDFSKNGFSGYINRDTSSFSFKGQSLQGPKQALPLKEIKEELDNLLLEIIDESKDEKKLDLLSKSVIVLKKPFSKWLDANEDFLTDSEKELIGDYYHEIVNNFNYPYTNYIFSKEAGIEPNFDSVDNLAKRVFKDYKKTTKRYKFFIEEGLTQHNKNLPEMIKMVLKPELSALKRRNIKIRLQGRRVLNNQKIKFRQTDYEIYIILRNLTQNASKYSPSNSKIKVKFQLDKKNSLLNVSVEDQGIGIKPKEFEKVMEGYRASNALESGIPGSGQGLRRVVKLIEETGQKLKIESPVNPRNKKYPGTRMSFSIPVVIQD